MKRIILGETVNNEGLAVLLDNLTLLFSARLIKLHDLIKPHDIEDIMSAPWGETTDASVFAEVCALSTLIDALILYDTIYIQSDYINRWYEALPELHEIVTLVDIKPAERGLIQEQMQEMANWYSLQKHFLRYVRYLQSKDLEGAFLRTAFHYHGIGAAWIKESATHISIDKISDLLSGKKHELEEACGNLEILGRYSGKSILPQVCMLLASGSFFHQAIASMLGIAYLPHAFRAPFCLFDAWTARAIKGVTYSPIKLLEQQRSESAKEVNSLLGDGICDLFIPALLATVLKQSQNPADIIREALKIRNHPSTVHFRKYLLSLLNDLKKGNLKDVNLTLKQIQDTINSMVKRTVNKVNIKISLSPAIEFPFELKSGQFKSIVLGDRLLFVKSVWASIAEVASLEQEMARVWGEPFNQRRHKMHEVWEWLRIDPSSLATEMPD